MSLAMVMFLYNRNILDGELDYEQYTINHLELTVINRFRFAKPIEVGSSNEEIEISITVRNSGTHAEDSYETMLYVELPEGMLYSGITNANAVSAGKLPIQGNICPCCNFAPS